VSSDWNLDEVRCQVTERVLSRNTLERICLADVLADGSGDRDTIAQSVLSR